MKISVASAVSIIVSLFSEEEKEILKIKLPSKSITLADQLLARYVRAKPLYDNEAEFEIRAALIKDNYWYLFRSLIEDLKAESREEFYKRYKNIDNHLFTRKASGDSDAGGASLSANNSRFISKNATGTKVRSAGSAGGQEIKEIDKVWEKEDNKFLNKLEAKNELNKNVSYKEGKRLIDKIKIQIEGSPEEKKEIEIFEDPTEDNVDRERDAIFHSINTSQNRVKGLSVNSSNSLNAGTYDKHKEFKNSTSIGYLMETEYSLWSEKVRGNRDFALGRFDVLFKLPRCL